MAPVGEIAALGAAALRTEQDVTMQSCSANMGLRETDHTGFFPPGFHQGPAGI